MELPDVFTADDNVERMKEFTIMPSIWYIGHIKKSEVKPTKSGTGTRLNLQVVIECSEEEGFKEGPRQEDQAAERSTAGDGLPDPAG